MMMKIQRIFHPIGQGAFYSERHENFNIVYDCGELKNSRLAEKVVKGAFSKGDKIDILFISHFDFDHISKISILKESASCIKNVVMPFLDDSDKNILLNFYRAIDLNNLNLIKNPEKFFGSGTRIISVLPDNNNSNLNNDNPININDLDQRKTTIPSGQALFLESDYDWIYIPYNHNQVTINPILKIELEKAGFDYERLKIDPNHKLEAIIKDTALPRSKGGKKLKAIYQKIGDINVNSMLLYSGPNKSEGTYYKNSFYRNLPHWSYQYPSSDRVGCIYTGDTNLNKIKIQQIFKNQWDKVGTIQIPHHGSISSFNCESISGGNFLCPISVGTNNTFGHPSSKVVCEILKYKNLPICVTEKSDSGFIEIISNEPSVQDCYNILTSVVFNCKP